MGEYYLCKYYGYSLKTILPASLLNFLVLFSSFEVSFFYFRTYKISVIFKFNRFEVMLLRLLLLLLLLLLYLNTLAKSVFVLLLFFASFCCFFSVFFADLFAFLFSALRNCFCFNVACECLDLLLLLLLL